MNNNLMYSKLKEVVADQIISLTQPFRENRLAILQNKKEYQDKVSAASSRIRKQAFQTIKEVKELIGLLNIEST